MRVTQLAVLGIGVALAGFGVYMAQSYVAQTQAAIAAAQAQRDNQPAIETREVLVAARALRFGEPITEDVVRAVPWPADALPPDVFQDMAALLPVAGRPRVALRAIEPMEPLMRVKVSEPGQSAGIAATLSPGMRAFTIRIDSSSGISGSLRPSNLVDIYWTGRGRDGEVTRLIGSNVRIIALDENADQDRDFTGVPRSVTIEGTPEKVATLAQGQSTGRLSLSLVGLDDASDLSTFEVDRRSLLGFAPEAAPTQEERCSIRTRRGNEVVLIEIPCTN